MTLYMETTKVASAKTIGEVMALLMEMGASKILQDCDNGSVSAVAFVMPVGNGLSLPFRLPVNEDAVFQYLQSQRNYRFRERREDGDREQAERVAWRHILRWIQAQWAMIQTGMVDAGEVFLPYVQVGNEGQTFYRQLESNGFKSLPLLEAPNADR